jgi:hypothetical protein
MNRIAYPIRLTLWRLSDGDRRVQRIKWRRRAIYDAGRRYRMDLDRRAACLQVLVTTIAPVCDTRLVLEQDDTLRGDRCLSDCRRDRTPHR